MWRLLLILALLVCAPIAAQATDITVSSFVISNSHGYTGAVRLRVYYTGCTGTTFLTNDSQIIMCGQVGSTTGFYKEVVVPVSSGTLTIPAFTLPSTDNALPPTIRAHGIFFVAGARRDNLFTNWVITNTLGPTVSFAALYAYQPNVIPSPLPATYLTAAQIAALIAASVSGNTGLGPCIPTASLPTPTSGGSLRCVSDGQRGVWRDNGTSWEPLNGRGVYNVIEDFASDLQAAIDAVPAVSGLPGDFGSGADVRLNRGRITLTKPIIIDKNYVKVGGLSAQSASTLSASGFYGPLVYVVPSNYPLVSSYLTTALLTGSGSAYIMPGNDSGVRYLNLSDIDSMDLNGKSQLCAETTLKPTLDTTGNFFARDILSSTGRQSSSTAFTHAFYVYQYNNNSVVGTITTSNATVTLTSPDNALLLNQNNHVALTYDGATARLFVRGILQASSALTGTIQQGSYEQIVLGGSTNYWPSRINPGATAEGSIDSIRISSVARYTTGFTPPTAKFTPDASNLLLLNFDTFYRNMVVGTVGVATPAYIPFRMCGICAGTLLKGVNLHDIQFATSSGGLYATSSILTRYDNLTFNDPRISMWLFDNDFLHVMRNIRINAASGTNINSMGLLITQQSGVGQIDSVDITGGVYQMVVATGSGTYNRIYLAPNTYTIYSGIFQGGGAVNAQYVFNGLITDYETAAITTPGGSLLFDQPAIVTINGSLLEMNPTGGLVVPNIVIDGGNSYTFTGVQSYNANLGEFVKFLAAPSGTVTLMNPYKYVPAQPYASGADLTKIRVFDTNGQFTMGNNTPFASLGTPPNSTITYCSDCTNASNPCTGAGTGAFAKRINGAWDCR